MGILAKPLGFLLSWLYELIGSYGIALIIVTVIVKLCLYPVYAKSIKSTMKMTEVQPKIQEIQQKYAKDRELMNEKMTELYKEEGVSMYGGCLPMVVQMIVIMGLFALLRNPMAYIDSDSMLFAIHEPFLWIQDLAQPDKWILPIMAAVATFIATLMSQNATAGANAQQTKMMNSIMKYLFPIMILWMARSYPAGLAIYWFGSQLIQIFYNMRFAKMRKESAEKRAKASKKKARA
ncbi:MAG: YidC/Oxa1 family membrane protein insertase [Firmicutes bacterium]|nr:YidC/Oxa1 family membrane protein insertase [Bacillota bacterium]